MTGASILETKSTVIKGNSIDNLDFLCLEIDTHDFTFQGNTIKNLALESLVVNNATTIKVTNNSFYHIERFGLTWLRSKQEEGKMTFSGNHFYNYERGSLLFYFSVYNEHLVIDSNILHTTTCNCTTMQLIEQMTEVDDNMIHSFRAERELTNQMFMDTSFCHDGEGKEINLSDYCDGHSHQKWHTTVIVIMGVCGILVIFVVKKCCCNRRYKSLLKDSNMNIDATHSQIVTDSDSDEITIVLK